MLRELVADIQFFAHCIWLLCHWTSLSMLVQCSYNTSNRCDRIKDNEQRPFSFIVMFDWLWDQVFSKISHWKSIVSGLVCTLEIHLCIEKSISDVLTCHWLDFLLMPSHVASHAIHPLASYVSGSLVFFSLADAIGRRAQKVERGQGGSSNVSPLSVIWSVLHVFLVYTCILVMKGSPQPTWHRQQEAWLDDCFFSVSEWLANVHHIFWLPGS